MAILSIGMPGFRADAWYAAVRSAQVPEGYAAFSWLEPFIMEPSAILIAAPT